jgi:hypothetical protein
LARPVSGITAFVYAAIDPNDKLAELHDRLAEGWRLLGMHKEAEAEHSRARRLRESSDAHAVGE